MGTRVTTVITVVTTGDQRAEALIRGELAVERAFRQLSQCAGVVSVTTEVQEDQPR